MKKFLSFMLAAATVMSCIVLSSSGFPVWWGDADGDGKINLNDVTLVLKDIAGWEVELAETADYDDDGKVNLSDVTNILKYIAGWTVTNDELLEAAYGVEEVYFEVPDPVTDKTVNGSEFGIDPEAADNSAALNSAAAYLRENPGTHLIIDKGTYRICAAVTFSGIKDCIIDWSGSTIILNKPITQFHFKDSENVKFCNLTEKWDWESSRIRSMVKVKSIVSNTPDSDVYYGDGYYDVEFEFLNETDAEFMVDVAWTGWVGVNPETYDFLPDTTMDLSSQKQRVFNKKFVGGNVCSATLMLDDPCEAGDVYYLSHYSYSGGFVRSTNTNGLVLEDLNVYGHSGGGFYIMDKSHHVRMTRVVIDVDPERYENGERISTNVDAIHVADTCGYLIIEDSTVGYSGDDCLNIHTNVGVVQDYGDDYVIIDLANSSSFHVGETVRFRRGDNYEHVDFTAKIVKREAEGRLFTLYFDRDDVYDYIEAGMVAIDADRDDSNMIVRNNNFHHCYARALLLGSSNCLVENNRFYAMNQEAIRICVDITTYVWTEGAGTDNMIIRNNVFENCNYLGKAYNNTVISIFATNGFNKDTQERIIGSCFENILFANNKFINPIGYLVNATNLKNFTFYGNDVEYTGVTHLEPSNIDGVIYISGQHFDGSSIVNNTWHKSEFMPEIPEVIKYYDSPYSEMTVNGNTVK